MMKWDAVGKSTVRQEGGLKVTGNAQYACEHTVDEALYLYPICSTVCTGRIVGIDLGSALEIDGVVGAITHWNAPRLAECEDAELWVLQSDVVSYWGQVVAGIIAVTLESAIEAASLVVVEYVDQGCDVKIAVDRSDFYFPDHVNPSYPTLTESGDVAAALQKSDVLVDETYTTPMVFQQPMEPHSTMAVWESNDGKDSLVLYDSTQGPSVCQQRLAQVFGLPPGRVTVVAPHVGGGFGSKLYPHAHQVLAVLVAKMVQGRTVKFSRPREAMFYGVGYRSATIQRLQLGSDRNGQLGVISHDASVFSSKFKEFAEASAVCSRTMYAAPNRRTSHRVAGLDLSVPSVMRGPGIVPGMFALESAMDELAAACGQDPIEARLMNLPASDPTSGLPFSTHNLAACLEQGAKLFNWSSRSPSPGLNREGEWMIGFGVAAATYPLYVIPGSTVRIRWVEGKYVVEMAAVDIGTGTRTALTQIAADALGVSSEYIELRIGNSQLPFATQEGASAGISSWGSAILSGALLFSEKYGPHPFDGDEVTGLAPDNFNVGRFSMHSFGAQFAEVRVSSVTGEVRVSRMLGVFACGRIINPLAARSQLVGGMCMGISMALLESASLDRRYGNIVNHELSSYHIASHADVESVDAVWIDESDFCFNALGAKGVGEIGVVGAAAAVANATFNACGIRVRDLPITPEKCLRDL